MQVKVSHTLELRYIWIETTVDFNEFQLFRAGVILESEECHRVAYNAAFEHFDVKPKGGKDVAVWSVKFYDALQNKVGGGKPKMRWYFGRATYTSNCRLSVVIECLCKLSKTCLSS